MALWAGTSLNTNETAFLFNKLATRKAIAMVRKNHGLTYALLGKREAPSPDGMTRFQRLQTITGNKIEQRLLGNLRTPATLADANQTDAVTLSWDNDAWGAAEWSMTHYTDTVPLPNSEMDRIRGDEAKTASFIDEFLEYVMLGYEKKWGTDMHRTGYSGGVGDASRILLMSVPYAIEGYDGAWTDAADDYGTIARDDSGNADFRGQVQSSVGTLTLAKIRTSMFATKAYNGTPSVGVGDGTVLNKVHQLVENYSQVTYNEKWSEFGGEYVRYAGIDWLYDNDTPSGYAYLLTPETWRLYMKSTAPFTESGIILDPSKKASYVLPTQFWMQLVCLHPAQNAVLKGITD